MRDILESGVSDREKSYCLNSTYYKLEYRKWYDRKFSENKRKQQHDYVFEPVEFMEIDDEYFKGGFGSKQSPNLIGKIVCKNSSRNGSQPSQGTRIYSPNGKAICLDSDGRKYIIDKSDGKHQPIYEVKNGLITIKDKQYPIKLLDGYYIIRKLTVTECCRLQGMPEWWFDDADGKKIISNTQCYKGLGNGWQLDTVKHIMSYLPIDKEEKIICLSMYDGIGTGRRILEELGYKNVYYIAYEIDAHCIKLTSYRYPSILHMGDAFQVREEGWLQEIYDNAW